MTFDAVTIALNNRVVLIPYNYRLIAIKPDENR